MSGHCKKCGYDGCACDETIDTMKDNWITIALENGGVLTASKNQLGTCASMNWRKLPESVSGGYCSTLSEALVLLNSELENDAANEISL